MSWRALLGLDRVPDLAPGSPHEHCVGHGELPPTFGSLSRYSGHARITGPCGDTMEMWLRVEEDQVALASYATDGCWPSIASGHAAVLLAMGQPLRRVAGVGQEQVLAALGGLPEESRHCALLAATTLQAALDDHRRRTSPVTRITVVYDNRSTAEALTAAWGFACVVETPSLTLLFDTGADGPTLMANMAALGIDATTIEAVLVSHNHWDHTGGLADLLQANDQLTVYALPGASPEVRGSLPPTARWIELTSPTDIGPHIRTIGPMGDAIVEQAIVVRGAHGSAVVTGCAHPGIVPIVAAARTSGAIALVLGGFHLKDATPSRVGDVIADLAALGVHRVAPCHCTGDAAIAQFESSYGPSFIRVEVGTRLEIEPWNASAAGDLLV